MVPDTPEELIRLGYKARRDGRLTDARANFWDAAGLSREARNEQLLATALAGLGQIERDLKNTAAALQHYREAVEIGRRGSHPLRLAHTIRHLADILRSEGDLEAARPLYEEALSIYRNDPEAPPLDLANAIRGFALLRGSAGEAGKATILWKEARSIYASVDVQAGVQESEAQINRLTTK